MYRNKAAFLLVAGAFALCFLLTACNKNECKDAICSPCPSSRFVIEYQDSTGACPAAFHSSAVVYAIRADNPNDTAYTYNFSDSCHVGFLVDEEMVYHVRGTNPTVHDVIFLLDHEYQDPIFVTECCLCYPVSHADFLINGDSAHVEYPAGKYENTAYVRTLN